MTPSDGTGAKTAERAPTTTGASPDAIRSRSSRRSASVSAECSTATRSPKRSRKRPSVCGVSAISGTSTIAPRPRASAASHARMYTSVLPLPVAPWSRRLPPDRRAARRCGRARAPAAPTPSPARPPPSSHRPQPARAAHRGASRCAARRARARAPASSRSSRPSRARGRRAPAAASPRRARPARSSRRPAAHPDLGDDAAPARVAEPHLDDRALLGPSGTSYVYACATARAVTSG